MSYFVVFIVANFAATMGSPLTRSGVLNQLTIKAERTELVDQLTATFRRGANQERLAKWEELLRPMYKALPKNPFGHLEHAAARYALHRAFVKTHGWTLSGLEPTRQTMQVNNSSSTEFMKAWVPEYLLTVIEELLGTHGISLRELAVLAATFEDLSHKEAHERLRDVFERLKIPTDSAIDDEQAENAMGTYMIMYTSAHGHEVKTPEDVDRFQLVLEKDTKKWLETVMINMTSLDNPEPLSLDDLDFAKMTRVIEEVGEQYASFNDQECSALKDVLQEVEDPYKRGRVRLSDFYKKGLSQGYWNLDEKVDYLRAMGALDESSPNRPRVIIPNYISSHANCISSSGFYTICCRNECEDKMGQLEASIGAPMGDAKKIEKLVADLRSDPDAATKSLPAELLRRLKDVSDYHDGQIPLHGRLFAQWMHHAFPRECPYPQEFAENSQTPAEWMRDSGEESTKASEQERLLHVQKPVAENKLKVGILQRNQAAPVAAALDEEDEEDKVTELPWSPAERLIVQPTHAESVSSWAGLLAVSETASYLLLLAFLVAGVLSAREAWQSRPSLAKKYDDFKKSKLAEEDERSMEHLARAERVRRRHKIEQAAQLEDVQLAAQAEV